MSDKKRILNCYSGIGGNRRDWGDEYEIVAVASPHIGAHILKHAMEGTTANQKLL